MKLEPIYADDSYELVSSIIWKDILDELCKDEKEKFDIVKTYALDEIDIGSSIVSSDIDNYVKGHINLLLYTMYRHKNLPIFITSQLAKWASDNSQMLQDKFLTYCEKFKGNFALNMYTNSRINEKYYETNTNLKEIIQKIHKLSQSYFIRVYKESDSQLAIYVTARKNIYEICLLNENGIDLYNNAEFLFGIKLMSDCVTPINLDKWLKN